MRKLALLGVWFYGTLVTLFIAAYFLLYTTQALPLLPSGMLSIRTLSERDASVAYVALPDDSGEVLGTIRIGDARPFVVEQFLERYGAPLAPQAAYMVRAADHYGLPDFRILPAIAMQESIGCKVIPASSNNCWGYGVYGDHAMQFTSLEDAIDRVARGLREDYYDQGLTTPYQIMTKYTPPSLAVGGTWAQGVEYFMAEME